MRPPSVCTAGMAGISAGRDSEDEDDADFQASESESEGSEDEGSEGGGGGSGEEPAGATFSDLSEGSSEEEEGEEEDEDDAAGGGGSGGSPNPLTLAVQGLLPHTTRPRASASSPTAEWRPPPRPRSPGAS